MASKIKRKQTKFTGGTKVTLAALSVISFVGGWDLIARVDNQKAQAKPSNPVSPQNSLPVPTPWPTIAPLSALPPIPTLPPSNTASSPAVQADSSAIITENPAPAQLAPIPALAPLPPMPDLPPLPPPPAQTWNGNGNHSGGS